MGVLTKAVKNFDDGDFDAIVVVAPSTKVRVFFVSFQKKKLYVGLIGSDVLMFIGYKETSKVYI